MTFKTGLILCSLSLSAFSRPMMMTYLGESFSKVASPDAKQKCEKKLNNVLKRFDEISSDADVKVVFSQCREEKGTFQVELEFETSNFKNVVTSRISSKNKKFCEDSVDAIKKRLSEIEDIFAVDVTCKAEGENVVIQMDYFNLYYMAFTQAYPTQTYTNPETCLSDATSIFSSLSLNRLFPLTARCEKYVGYDKKPYYKAVVDYFKPIDISLKTEEITSNLNQSECLSDLGSSANVFESKGFPVTFFECNLVSGLFIGKMYFIDDNEDKFRTLSITDYDRFNQKEECTAKGTRMEDFHVDKGNTVLFWSCLQERKGSQFRLKFMYY